MQNLLQKWYRILENETNRKVTILIPVEQRKCKKDEENKHQKQATLVREPNIREPKGWDLSWETRRTKKNITNRKPKTSK